MFQTIPDSSPAHLPLHRETSASSADNGLGELTVPHNTFRVEDISHDNEKTHAHDNGLNPSVKIGTPVYSTRAAFITGVIFNVASAAGMLYSGTKLMDNGLYAVPFLCSNVGLLASIAISITALGTRQRLDISSGQSIPPTKGDRAISDSILNKQQPDGLGGHAS